jgi:hypothetical protein
VESHFPKGSGEIGQTAIGVVTGSHNAALAQALAAQGIPIFPCAANKKPLGPWKSIATADPATVASMWRKNPNALPAIDCGKAGLVVIDCDRHGGPDGVAAFDELVNNEVFAPQVHTPRHGKHVYFRQPPGMRIGNSSGDLPAGIDVRGAGGYVIAPGTRLPDGRTYEAANFSLSEIVELPPMLIDQIVRMRARVSLPQMN